MVNADSEETQIADTYGELNSIAPADVDSFAIAEPDALNESAAIDLPLSDLSKIKSWQDYPCDGAVARLGESRLVAIFDSTFYKRIPQACLSAYSNTSTYAVVTENGWFAVHRFFTFADTGGTRGTQLGGFYSPTGEVIAEHIAACFPGDPCCEKNKKLLKIPELTSFPVDGGFPMVGNPVAEVFRAVPGDRLLYCLQSKVWQCVVVSNALKLIEKWNLSDAYYDGAVVTPEATIVFMNLATDSARHKARLTEFSLSGKQLADVIFTPAPNQLAEWVKNDWRIFDSIDGGIVGDEARKIVAEGGGRFLAPVSRWFTKGGGFEHAELQSNAIAELDMNTKGMKVIFVPHRLDGIRYGMSPATFTNAFALANLEGKQDIWLSQLGSLAGLDRSGELVTMVSTVPLGVQPWPPAANQPADNEPSFEDTFAHITGYSVPNTHLFLRMNFIDVKADGGPLHAPTMGVWCARPAPTARLF